MKQLTKKEAQDHIHSIFEFINSGKTQMGDYTYYGHPGFYFFHTKEDLNTKIDQYLNKKFYDEYDIYYIANMLIRYMLGKYDSHTKVKFKNNDCLPIQCKVQNGYVHIINLSPDLDNLIGATLVSINNIEIGKIMEEIEKITCYSTAEYLQTNLEVSLCNLNILKSLPSMNRASDSITFTVLYKDQMQEINFKSDTLLKDFHKTSPENYSYTIIEDCIVIYYNACKDKEKMDNLIEIIKHISQENDINNYIVDLRNNGGGDSKIVGSLIEYLKNKNIVVLINEKVFSSGRMAYVDLKRIGAYSVGTDISTSLNCFGNVPGPLEMNDLGLVVQRSSTYWLYNDLNCKGYNKDSFAEYFKTRKELLEPVLLHPDCYVYLSVDDIINNKDVQLEKALVLG